MWNQFMWLGYYLSRSLLMAVLDWLISDLIPKKSEKFEFRKNFMSIFFSVKNWPKKWNFDFFAYAIFEKLQNEVQNFGVGYLPEKWKILKKLILHRNQHKILCACNPTKKVFDPWVKSYEAFSISGTSGILELVIYNYQIYGYISNQNLISNSTQSKFFESAHANFLKADFLLNA